MGARSGISVGGHHPAIQAMHRGMALAAVIREEQEQQKMKQVTHRLPPPPAGHPWHAAAATAETARAEYRAYKEACIRSTSDKEANRLFGVWYSANKPAEALLEAWKDTVRAKFAEIHESIGEGRWQAFWAALPDGDAMTAVLDKKLDEIRGVTQ